jgi:hypothetical protein
MKYEHIWLERNHHQEAERQRIFKDKWFVSSYNLELSIIVPSFIVKTLVMYKSQLFSLDIYACYLKNTYKHTIY